MFDVALVLSVVLLQAALGVGILVAIERVVARRRERSRRWVTGVVVLGGVLLAFAVLATGWFLAWVLADTERRLDVWQDPAALAAEFVAAITVALIAAAGGMLVHVATADPQRRAPGGAYRDFRFGVLTVIAWGMLAGAGVYLCVGLEQVFPVVWLPVPLAALLYALGVRRLFQKESLLWTLAVAAHRGLPLGPALDAFSEQCGGAYRRRVLALAERLDAGVSLPDALERDPRILPHGAAIIARAGWETGTLGRVLPEAAAARSARQPLWNALIGRLIYLATVLLCVQASAVFLLGGIAPRLQRIYEDFGVTLPYLTRLLMGLGDFDRGGWVLAALWFGELACLALLPPLYFVLGGLPGVDRWFRRLHGAVVLRVLAIHIGCGQPMTRALETLARSYPRRSVRLQLARASALVSDGAAWHASLERSGIIQPADAALVRAAERVGNLPWALREIADSGERRFGYRLQACAHVLFPVVVAGIGLLIFLLAVAYFGPLVKLIQEMTV